MQRFISVHITDICNEKCNFCVVASPFFSKSEVRDDDVWRFLKDFSGKGYEAINIHGGEPTVYPRLTDFLGYAHELGYVEIHMQTNGRKLKDKAFAKKLIDNHVVLFIVSLHGATAAVHNKLVATENAWEDTLIGIQNVKELGAKVRTNIVVTKSNTSQLEDYGLLVKQLNVDHVNISNLHPVGSAFFSFGTLAPEFRDVRPKLYKLIQLLQISGIPVTLEGFPYCTVSEYTELILEGNPRDIPLLWKGKVINSYDDFMDDGRTKNEECKSCKFNSVCGGVYKEYVKFRGWAEITPIC